MITDEDSMWLKRAVPNVRWTQDGAMEIEEEGEDPHSSYNDDDIQR